MITHLGFITTRRTTGTTLRTVKMTPKAMERAMMSKR